MSRIVTVCGRQFHCIPGRAMVYEVAQTCRKPIPAEAFDEIAQPYSQSTADRPFILAIISGLPATQALIAAARSISVGRVCTAAAFLVCFAVVLTPVDFYTRFSAPMVENSITTRFVHEAQHVAESRTTAAVTAFQQAVAPDELKIG